eukprot:6716366-Prymnesium_polylepis.1
MEGRLPGCRGLPVAFTSASHAVGRPTTPHASPKPPRPTRRGLQRSDRRLGPALAQPGYRDFKVSFIHASHALPC